MSARRKGAVAGVLAACAVLVGVMAYAFRVAAGAPHPLAVGVAVGCLFAAAAVVLGVIAEIS